MCDALNDARDTIDDLYEELQRTKDELAKMGDLSKELLDKLKKSYRWVEFEIPEVEKLIKRAEEVLK